MKGCYQTSGNQTHYLLITSRDAHPTEPPKLAQNEKAQTILCKHNISSRTLFSIHTLWYSMNLLVDSGGHDQTALMGRLICTFIVGIKIGFPMVWSKCITKTYLYKFDPLKPHFYYCKTAVYRGIHYFSYFCSKHRL